MRFLIPFLVLVSLCACNQNSTSQASPASITSANVVHDSVSDFQRRLADSALAIINPNIKYTPDYVSIPYPNGDVPALTGVCSDVVIRAYRKMGIDLQQLVHKDMSKHFNLYPKRWGLKTTDKNIDHRRVPNLEVYFEKFGKKLPITKNANDYKTGEIVTWMIGNKLPHIGIVTNRLSKDKKRRLIVHNVGSGQVLEDVLFAYPIVGHYRFEP